jgi:hypothetical protein
MLRDYISLQPPLLRASRQHAVQMQASFCRLVVARRRMEVPSVAWRRWRSEQVGGFN